MNLRDLLAFFLKDSGWVKKILIGGAFCIVSLYELFFRILWGEGIFASIFIYLILGFLMVLMFFPFGFSSRLLKMTLEKQEGPLPEWKEWPELFKEGAKIFLVTLIYGVAVAIVMMVITFFSSKIPVLGAVFSFLYIVTGLLMAVASPFIAIAVCRMISSGSFASAFDFPAIYQEFSAKAEEYITLSLLLIGIKAIMAVSFGLPGFSYIHPSGALWMMRDTFPLVKLISPFATFCFLIIIFRGYGKIYIKNKST